MIHGADPWWDIAIRLMLKYRNLRLMTSAWSPKRLPPALLHYLATRGTDRILFASDYPVLSMQRCLDEARELDLTPEVRDAWLYGNAEAFFFSTRARQEHRRSNMNIRPIDADNHYYEPLDAFTRHLDRPSSDAGFAPCRTASASSSSSAVGSTASFPIRPSTRSSSRAASTRSSAARFPEGVNPAELIKVEPLKAEYRDRDARIAVADAQGLDAVLLFPTLGCGVEEALRHDIPATMASLSAFNRWLEEDWGFSYRDRLIGVPMLSLADPDAALGELSSLIERGARIVHVRPAPVPAPQRHRPVARRHAARPGVGAARRGVDPRRVPPR